ncbi:putative delta DNA polymerase [Cystobasidium minutum MCA 4210]|uniref:putative delta DNA polymerase n=1 Tax=Cystobasidium minutum MCA 4210 TaxID=1397322 RepID=UPI0034CEF86A|eukprot:jgi/Rhomi1/173982/fgenesh1_kg.7_\
MDSDDDNSSGGASSLSRSSVELSPHPEEENIAPHGNISNANSGKSRITATLDAVSNVGKVNGVAVPTTPRKNQAAAGSPSRKRRLGSPTASISFDGAHATPPSAIGGGLMPSPEKKKQKKLEIPSSSQTTGPSGSQKLKGKKKEGQGEGWEEVLERLGATASAEDGQEWARPHLERFTPKDRAIIFQSIDIEETSIPGQGPVLRCFGVTQEGYSVLAHIRNFLPYFWVVAPRGFTLEDCVPLMTFLNVQLSKDGARVVQSISIAQKRSLWGYRGDEVFAFLKITLTDQKFVSRTKTAFERGELNFRNMFSEAPMTFESNIPYTLRFMIDHKIGGMSWLEIPHSKYELRAEAAKISVCQIEIDVDEKFLIAHEAVGEWSKIAPLRILSFDIECAGRKGIFPDPDIDPVIQIAAMVTRQGETKPFVRNVFTLNTCSNIVGSDVRSFEDETAMLNSWQAFVNEVDPDLVIGYNTANFDIPYLMDRAKKVRAFKFAFLGRLKNVKSEVKDTHFSSKAYGTRDSKETKMDGRLQLDILQVMQRDYKLRSYSLNSVCAHFLGEQKEDVHYSIITELQNGNAETRRRLAVYCLKDAYLPQRLMDKLMCFINYTEMARVTGVPFNYLISRGQQIKVVSQLFRKAQAEGYVVPALKSEGSDEQYEGATVIEPTKGYYDVPIATLDFASLYPSIMMAHNLCYTTLLDPSLVTKLGLVKDEDYIITPNNDYFVSAKKRKGLLPIVLEDLLAARKRAKSDLKKETDPFKRAVLDGRQLALKISANSVYGFTGATVGKLPCLQISTSVTAYGRQMIETTKQSVESQYNKENGYEYDAQVIYGDTDSVMIKFGCPDIETAMKLGAEAALKVTENFVRPIKLEFEKVYFPYLLISKKRYAGLYWTKPDKWDKMDAKGIETVRRDNCRLVSTVIGTCLNKLLMERDVIGAQEYVKSTISDLLQNKVDLSQLVITKALAKADYAAKQAHVELAGRMKKRDAGSAPTLGDRVAYVIIKGSTGARAYEKAEDPLYVLENNLPVDTRHYLENQLSKPLLRIFEPILGEKANSLLAGDHTRTVTIATPTTGGLMGFVKKTLTCLACRAPIGNVAKGMNTAICKNCRAKGRTPEMYQKHLTLTTAAEAMHAKLWTNCQRCQGSLHQDVVCQNGDCPIFYMRRKAMKDVEDNLATLVRFDGEW